MYKQRWYSLTRRTRWWCRVKQSLWAFFRRGNRHASSFGNVSDADFGTASNLYLNPNYSTPLDEGIVVNISGVLIEGVSTGITPIFPAVSGVLYSFDYTVSEEAAYGQIISLFADLSGGAINEVWCNIGPGFRLEAITPESLSLTVVPEPITIVLLGTGSLLLARRNKRRL